jgi:hypothetical protein
MVRNEGCGCRDNHPALCLPTIVADTCSGIPSGVSSAFLLVSVRQERAMRILVSGATGVIGRRVIPLLVSQGHSVTGLARNTASGYLPATLAIWFAVSAVRQSRANVEPSSVYRT